MSFLYASSTGATLNNLYSFQQMLSYLEWHLNGFSLISHPLTQAYVPRTWPSTAEYQKPGEKGPSDSEPLSTIWPKQPIACLLLLCADKIRLPLWFKHIHFLCLSLAKRGPSWGMKGAKRSDCSPVSCFMLKQCDNCRRWMLQNVFWGACG